MNNTWYLQLLTLDLRKIWIYGVTYRTGLPYCIFIFLCFTNLRDKHKNTGLTLYEQMTEATTQVKYPTSVCSGEKLNTTRQRLFTRYRSTTSTRVWDISPRHAYTCRRYIKQSSFNRLCFSIIGTFFALQYDTKIALFLALHYYHKRTT